MNDGDNVVSGNEAFGFFLKSRLPQQLLGQIWELSDLGSKGYLTEAEFYTAIGLVGVAQAGGTITPVVARQISEGAIQTPNPKFDGYPDTQQAAPLGSTSASTISGWKPTPADVSRYQKIFKQVDTDHDTRVGGRECVEVFKQWGLPIDVLKKTWDTVDRDKDGFLNEHEFCTALAIMEGIKKGDPMPEAFPASLVSINASQSNNVQQNSSSSLSSLLNSVALEPLPQPSSSQSYSQPPLQSQVPVSTLSDQGVSIPPRDKSDLDALRQSAQDTERKSYEIQGNIQSSKAQQNAILNEKQALVRFKAKMDSQLTSASIEFEDLARKTAALEQELSSRREEAKAAQERVQQRAIETEALEKRLEELMAMQAQLNVSDEDRSKSSDDLRHEVEEMTAKIELLESKSKLVDMQSRIKVSTADLDKSSEYLENEVRALETKVELLQRKAKATEKVEWLDNLNRDMESAFQEEFEDDGFDEVLDEDEKDPNPPDPFLDSSKRQSAPAAPTASATAISSFESSGFGNENAFDEDPFSSLPLSHGQSENNAQNSRGQSDNAGAFQAQDKQFESFGFGDKASFKSQAEKQNNADTNAAFASGFESTSNGASTFQTNTGVSDNSFATSLFSDKGPETGNGNANFDSAFSASWASEGDPFGSQEPEKSKVETAQQASANNSSLDFGFGNDAFSSLPSSQPAEAPQADLGFDAFGDNAFG